MDTIIELQSVAKSFWRKAVLTDVSLTVTAGGVWALLGENGAGKTTLIRTLMGFHRPDRGSVRVLGRDPGRDPLAVRRAVGYVSDFHQQPEWMTVGELGWFTSSFFAPGFSERYQQTLAGSGISADARLRQLSKGERAQVSLALAVAHDPDLLILDEPTSGLDPVVRREFLEQMVERAAQGKSVFLSSHQIAEVERVADRVAILHQGKIAIAGAIDDLKSNFSVVQIAVREPGEYSPPANPNLAVKSAKRSGRVWTLVVEGEVDGWVSSISGDPQVLQVGVHRPALEDLYLAIVSPHLVGSKGPAALVSAES
jgi:ABC-2 type transport system ATP-binding protein